MTIGGNFFAAAALLLPLSLDIGKDASIVSPSTEWNLRPWMNQIRTHTLETMAFDLFPTTLAESDSQLIAEKPPALQPEINTTTTSLPSLFDCTTLPFANTDLPIPKIVTSKSQSETAGSTNATVVEALNKSALEALDAALHKLGRFVTRVWDSASASLETVNTMLAHYDALEWSSNDWITVGKQTINDVRNAVTRQLPALSEYLPVFAAPFNDTEMTIKPSSSISVNESVRANLKNPPVVLLGTDFPRLLAEQRATRRAPNTDAVQLTPQVLWDYLASFIASIYEAGMDAASWISKYLSAYAARAGDFAIGALDRSRFGLLQAPPGRHTTYISTASPSLLNVSFLDIILLVLLLRIVAKNSNPISFRSMPTNGAMNRQSCSVLARRRGGVLSTDGDIGGEQRAPMASIDDCSCSSIRESRTKSKRRRHCQRRRRNKRNQVTKPAAVLEEGIEEEPLHLAPVGTDPIVQAASVQDEIGLIRDKDIPLEMEKQEEPLVQVRARRRCKGKRATVFLGDSKEERSEGTSVLEEQAVIPIATAEPKEPLDQGLQQACLGESTTVLLDDLQDQEGTVDLEEAKVQDEIGLVRDSDVPLEMEKQEEPWVQVRARRRKGKRATIFLGDSKDQGRSEGTSGLEEQAVIHLATTKPEEPLDQGLQQTCLGESATVLLDDMQDQGRSEATADLEEATFQDEIGLVADNDVPLEMEKQEEPWVQVRARRRKGKRNYIEKEQ